MGFGFERRCGLTGTVLGPGFDTRTGRQRNFAIAQTSFLVWVSPAGPRILNPGIITWSPWDGDSVVRETRVELARCAHTTGSQIRRVYHFATPPVPVEAVGLFFEDFPDRLYCCLVHTRASWRSVDL